MSDKNDRAETGDISRGRPREYNEDNVMSALLGLFWDKGYEATSLSDIMTATGLRKGSLYSLFGGKRDMYLKALMRYERDYVAMVCIMLKDKDIGSGAERLDQFLSLPIKAAHDNSDQRGCFLCNASADMAAHDAEIRDFIRQCYADMTAAIEQAVQESWPGGALHHITARARLLMAVYSGLRIMARSDLARDYMDSAKIAALDF
jgi:AcrR family transcriptional regulator